MNNVLKLSVIFSIFLYQRGTAQHRISITIDGIPAGKEIILGYHFADQKYAVDTVITDEMGKVVFYGDTELKPGMYFLYNPNEIWFDFIVKEQDFSLTFSKKELYKDLEVKNSLENELFKEFQLQMLAANILKDSILKSFKQTSKKEDTIAAQKKLIDIEKEVSNNRKSIIKKAPNSLVANILMLMERPEPPDYKEIKDTDKRRTAQLQYYKNHFLDNIHFKDIGLLRTPLLKVTVEEFFDKVVVPHPDTILYYCDKIIRESEFDAELFRFWLVTFFNKYEKSDIMGMEVIWVTLAEKYYLTGKADWLKPEDLTNLQEEVDFLRPNLIGKIAPRLHLLDTALNPLYLEQMNAKYMVLFFYDPNCGTCIKKTPELGALYPQLKALNAEVLAVCVPTKVDEWKNYVKKNKMKWLNGADPNTQSNFRHDYNVRYTPQIYILDNKKRIIAKKLDTSQIIEFIKNHSRYH
ncbi:MAG: redoxin domain-containing protein [Chitinophagaceae bacterium]|nr:redoxin domain-containing protein [Chitinophagaceae bacterium]